jgi:hypothetical protein
MKNDEKDIFPVTKDKFCAFLKTEIVACLENPTKDKINNGKKKCSKYLKLYFDHCILLKRI